ncbi:MAG: formate dehydrogenase subunit alpha [Halobacteriota archaeon]
MNFEYVPTICPYCGCGCGLNLVVQDGKLAGVEPWKRHPVNEGKLCPKGLAAHEFVHSEDRLTKPLIKKDGAFVESTWEEALDLVASKFKATQEANGPNSVAFLASARITNEENYLMNKLARVGFKTNYLDHCARLCHGPTVSGLAKSFGSGAMTNSIPDVDKADCIFIIGSNTMEQHPLIGRRVVMAKEKGATIIVADPRYSTTAKLADIYVPFKSGTDVALMNSMMYWIIEADKHDKEFIEARTKGFDELKETVKNYADVEDITTTPTELVKKAALAYASAENAALLYSMGITQHTTGTDNVLSTSNLAMLTGNIGRPGTGVNPLRGQNNVQGACDMGALPVVYSGYQSVAVDAMRQKMEDLWGVEGLPSALGLTVVEMMNAAGDEIKNMYIVGENPMLSDPDITHVREALQKLDFLVVQDIFLTETAELADVVLPGGCWAEKDGTFTNTERRVQRIRKAIEPPGEAKADWEIITNLANKLGVPGFNYQSAEDIMEEVRKATPQYAGITYARIDKPEALHWPCPTEEHPGTPILHTQKFTSPDGLGTLFGIEWKPPNEVPDAEYPYILSTGRILFHYHTGTMTRRSPTLNAEVPTGYVEVNPEDAKALGVAKGDKVKVRSRRGEVETLARVTEDIPKGMLFMPFHFKEGAANMLTNPALDPAAKMPEFKVCAAVIEKA